MGKKQQQVQHTEPQHIDHLVKAPKTRNSKEMSFDSLESFESYIKDESWDNEFDNLNIHLHYLPPFILHEIHDDEEKIKPTMNCHSKKFRRNLAHHLTKHLLPAIKEMSGIDYKFDKIGQELEVNTLGTESHYKWHFKDETNHGFDEGEYQNREHWTVELDVESNSSDPFVNVDFRATPLKI